MSTSPKVLGLGGLCETKYQIDRAGLPSDSGYFDWIVTPTVCLPKLIGARLHGTFYGPNLVLRGLWDERCYKAFDPEFGVSNVHDFVKGDSIRVNCERITSKFSHLARKFRVAMGDPAPLTLVHRVTNDDGFREAADADLEDVLAAVRKSRGGLPFHLVFVTVDGVVRPHRDDCSFYNRPHEVVYHWQGDNSSWDQLFGDLRSRGKL